MCLVRAPSLPFSPSRKSAPADAPEEKLFALHKRLGIERCVIVQSIVHGNDNAVVEDAIEAGGGNDLGVALTDVDVSDPEAQTFGKQRF
jgi:2-pyrone-4,6-dicarboxylate lactonase